MNFLPHFDILLYLRSIMNLSHFDILLYLRSIMNLLSHFDILLYLRSIMNLSHFDILLYLRSIMNLLLHFDILLYLRSIMNLSHFDMLLYLRSIMNTYAFHVTKLLSRGRDGWLDISIHCSLRKFTFSRDMQITCWSLIRFSHNCGVFRHRDVSYNNNLVTS